MQQQIGHADDGKRAELEHHAKTLTMINEWVRFLDTKAGAVLAANAAVIAAGFGLLKDNLPYLRNHYFSFGILVVACAMFVISVITCLYCIVPTLSPYKSSFHKLFAFWTPHVRRASEHDRTSVIFFGHIFTGPDYLARLREVQQDHEAISLQWAEQIAANSEVARSKSEWVAKAIQFLMWGLVLALFAAVLIVQKV
jgi:hypothetical protein